ncbi:MAG: arabinose transporter [Desulfovibrionaceae bacterium]|nr:arabinose transporter [Desulfovibrionaceae bacterium]
MSFAESKPFYPLVATHFFTFMVVGLPLPVLPLYVHKSLGYSTAVVGVTIGLHFVTTVLFRGMAGRLADTWGAKHTTLTGVLLAMFSGFPYLLAATPLVSDDIMLPCIFLGRILLGIAHSMVGTSLLAWGFGLLGPQHAGRVIAWLGISMYGSIALGAPLGLALWERWGILSLGAATCLLPLLALCCALGKPETPRVPKEKAAKAGHIIPRIMRPGICLALHGVGNAAISVFIVLYFASENWDYAGLALTCFGFSFILARVLCGEIPDKAHGQGPTLLFFAIEALGLLLVALAPSVAVAFLGIALTGFGCSLIYPSIGVELVRDIPIEARGVAVGWFTAFQDVSFGLTGPLTGLLVPVFGYPSVFYAASACAMLGFALTFFFAGPGAVRPSGKEKR